MTWNVWEKNAIKLSTGHIKTPLMVLTCVLTYYEYGEGWVRDARQHCWAFWRYRGPNSMKQWQRCPLDNPSVMLTKASLLLLLLSIKYQYDDCSAPCSYNTVHRLGCWAWVLACDSERFGCCGKSPTNSPRNLTSYWYSIVKIVLQSNASGQL